MKELGDGGATGCDDYGREEDEAKIWVHFPNK